MQRKKHLRSIRQKSFSSRLPIMRYFLVLVNKQNINQYFPKFLICHFRYTFVSLFHPKYKEITKISLLFYSINVTLPSQFNLSSLKLSIIFIVWKVRLFYCDNGKNYSWLWKFNVLPLITLFVCVSIKM
jgi:hypothetical protein